MLDRNSQHTKQAEFLKTWAQLEQNQLKLNFLKPGLGWCKTKKVKFHTSSAVLEKTDKFGMRCARKYADLDQRMKSAEDSPSVT